MTDAELATITQKLRAGTVTQKDARALLEEVNALRGQVDFLKAEAAKAKRGPGNAAMAALGAGLAALQNPGPN